jgi:uncharacterized protein
VDLEAIREALRRHVPVDELAAAYLFGSRARGDAAAASDLDLGLLLRRPPASTLKARRFGLADLLTEALGQRVDVVLLNDAPVDLVHRVLRDGVLLCEPDPAARVRFEVAARNAYFDLLPHLERYREHRP